MNVLWDKQSNCGYEKIRNPSNHGPILVYRLLAVERSKQRYYVGYIFGKASCYYLRLYRIEMKIATKAVCSWWIRGPSEVSDGLMWDGMSYGEQVLSSRLDLGERCC
jgi:hypothetical protein